MSAADRILLEGLHFYGYHGVLPEEGRLGQDFIVDLSIEADLSYAGHSDEVDDTISYAEVFTRVRQIVETERYSLLEALAEHLAAALLAYPQAQAVTVKITKPNAPIPGLGNGRVAVEIRRTR